LAATASYYGVNAISSGEWKGWGAMAEWCDVNGVCARQGYDAHGNLRWRSEAVGAVEKAGYSFQYDDQNRVSNGWYDRYETAGTKTSFNFAYTYAPAGSWPVKLETKDLVRKRGHFAAPAADSYTFDGAGNVLQRPGQALASDAENHLAQVTWGGRSEWYAYDERGGRVHKAEGTAAGQVTSNTWYFFPHYEVRQAGATTVVTKYYYFGGMLLAKAEGGVLTYLHTDSLGSVVLETDANGNVVNDQRYFAYGRRLDTGGDISGDRDFTGQKADATGLLYYNARYHDPQIGQQRSKEPRLCNSASVDSTP
jgi:RHS repeat-associated protein